MVAYQLPREIDDFLQTELPSEKAKKLSFLIEKSIAAISNRATDLALQKKLELKDELSKELVTKSDLSASTAQLNASIYEAKADIIKWVFVFVFSQTTILGAVIYALFKLAKII